MPQVCLVHLTWGEYCKYFIIYVNIELLNAFVKRELFRVFPLHACNTLSCFGRRFPFSFIAAFS